MTRSRLVLPALTVRASATALAAIVAALALVACDGLDMGTDSLPDPAIFEGVEAEACGSAGSTAIALDVVGARVVEGFAQTSQTGADRVEVTGRVTSLAAGEAIYGLLVGEEVNCPIARAVEVAPADDGTFLLTLGLSSGQTAFRVVAVSGPAGATPLCADATDCIQLDAAGAVVSVSGLSNTVGMRLP